MIYFSIIIPHKNSTGLLQYCLSSIPVRDDIQVIVVDDNSDPNKVDFMNFPKWKGGCYECYFTKEGKGAGYARNVGLEHAKGKWVLFVDADDFLVADADDIFESTIGVDADIVFYRPKSVMLHDRTTPSLRASNYNRIIDNYLLCDDPKEGFVLSKDCVVKILHFNSHVIAERFESGRFVHDRVCLHDFIDIACQSHVPRIWDITLLRVIRL